MIRIFKSDDIDFSSNGKKILQPLEIIEKKKNKEWLLECEFSLKDSEWLQKDYILVVETHNNGYQAFRVGDIEEDFTIQFEAKHISHDLEGYAIELATVIDEDCSTMLSELFDKAVPSEMNFNFSTSIIGTTTMSVIDSNIFEGLYAIAEKYGGVVTFDNWNITIEIPQEIDNGITLAYEKNLVGAKKVEDWSKVITYLKPIGNNGMTLIPNEWLVSDVQYDRPYAKIMQFDIDDYDNFVTYTQGYLNRYKYPRVNYQVDVGNLLQRKLSLKENIHVKARTFELMTEVIAYEFNVLTQRLKKVEFGNFEPTTKTYFGDLKADIDQIQTQKLQVKVDEILNIFSIGISDIQSLMQEEIENLDQSVIDRLGDYANLEDLVSLQNEISTQFTQTNEDFNFLFNDLLTTIQNIDGNAQTSFDEISSYIRFINGEIHLGRSDSSVSLIIKNDRISFEENGNEVAWITNSTLHINDSTLFYSLRIGDFQFTPRTNGNLSFGKVVR